MGINRTDNYPTNLYNMGINRRDNYKANSCNIGINRTQTTIRQIHLIWVSMQHCQLSD